MRWIGLDVHHKYIEMAEMRGDSTATTHLRFSVDEPGLKALSECLSIDDAHVILEAGTSSATLHDALKAHAGSVVVAHANQTRGAAGRHVKTDRRDAETLALLLRSGFVRAVWVPPPGCRALRSLLEYRNSLVVLRTATVNRIRSVFRSELADYPAGLSSDRMDKALGASWNEPDTAIMMRSLVAIGQAVSQQIRFLDDALERWCSHSDEAQLLMTIPGVGVVVAATVVSEIGAVERFASAGQICAYAGLVPSVYASGKTLRIGHVSPASRRGLRSALYLATMILIRFDKRFHDVYTGLCARRPKKVALIACARKLLVVIWHMLRERKPFRYERRDPPVTLLPSKRIEGKADAPAPTPSGSKRGARAVGPRRLRSDQA